VKEDEGSAGEGGAEGEDPEEKKKTKAKKWPKLGTKKEPKQKVRTEPAEGEEGAEEGRRKEEGGRKEKRLKGKVELKNEKEGETNKKHREESDSTVLACTFDTLHGHTLPAQQDTQDKTPHTVRAPRPHRAREALVLPTGDHTLEPAMTHACLRRLSHTFSVTT
jgi:hypothetical protein